MGNEGRNPRVEVDEIGGRIKVPRRKLTEEKASSPQKGNGRHRPCRKADSRSFRQVLILARRIPACSLESRPKLSYYLCQRDDFLDYLDDMGYGERVKVFDSLASHALSAPNSTSGLLIVAETIGPKFVYQVENCSVMARAIHDAGIKVKDAWNIPGMAFGGRFILSLKGCEALRKYLELRNRKAADGIARHLVACDRKIAAKPARTAAVAG